MKKILSLFLSLTLLSTLAFFKSANAMNQNILNRLYQNDPTLTSLDLSHNYMSPESVNHLAEALKINKEGGSIEFVDEIPKTSVGKFDKKVLKEEYRNIFEWR